MPVLGVSSARELLSSNTKTHNFKTEKCQSIRVSAYLLFGNAIIEAASILGCTTRHNNLHHININVVVNCSKISIRIQLKTPHFFIVPNRQYLMHAKTRNWNLKAVFKKWPKRGIEKLGIWKNLDFARSLETPAPEPDQSCRRSCPPRHRATSSSTRHWSPPRPRPPSSTESTRQSRWGQ